MSDKNHEQLSAFIDGEYTNDDNDVISHLLKDPEMKAIWSRFHLIGDSMRGHLSENVSIDISKQVSIALQDEPTVLAPVKGKKIGFKPLAGFAIAASVAMMAVFTVQKGNEIDTASTVPTVASVNGGTTVSQPQSFSFNEPQTLPAAVKKSDTPSSIANQRLNNYLMNHNGYRSNGDINGILPYVRIVTIEAQE